MKVLTRSGIVVGSLLLASLVLTVCAPRAVHAVAAALVQVTNTVSNPVPTEEALGTATLINAFCSETSPSGVSGFAVVCTFSDFTPFAIPSGQRAVLEYADGNCTTTSGATIGFANLTITRAKTFEPEVHYLPVLPATSVAGASSSSFATPIRLYLNTGDTLVLDAFTNDTAGGTVCSAYVTGRFVPTK